MIAVANLSKTFGKQVIFDDISFTINSGERVGLTGRNGTGKTTLLKMLTGDEEPDSGIISIPKGYTISYLSQHIHFTEETVLKEACINLDTPEDGADQTYKVKSILSGLGFQQQEFFQDPRKLSGGYQVRLNLAKILVSEPNLLLLDEPTNYLDIISVRWLTQFLRSWKNELIIVTHDRAFMNSVTTHTIGIHRQRIRKIAGHTEKLYQQILLEEEIYEKTRINDERKRKEAEQFINRFKAQASRARAVQSRVKMLQKKEKIQKLTEEKDLVFQFRYAPFTGKWLMEANGISFSFSEDAPLLIDGFSIAVGRHDRIGVIGKNGKGKTTLLNILAGEFRPTHGAIRYNQNLRLAYFGQMNVERLDMTKTVLEEVLDAQSDYSLGAARNICGSMMFEGDKAFKKISVLSGGERSRVLLGKLLTKPANLILLDEPDNHLDAESVDSLIEAIDNFDGAVIMVTHSEMILDAIATRLIVFDGGSAGLFEGTYGDFLERVGWADERVKITTNLPEIIEKEARVKGMGRKDIRRIRAQVINDRSTVLGPLQKKMAQLEDRITELEAGIDEDNKSLIRASQSGDGKKISQLSISIYNARKTIEDLFDELEKVTDEYNRNRKVFEERLIEIQAIDT